MICPNHNGPLCLTCRLGGLVRCPVLGTPLPLVESERTKVTNKPDDRFDQALRAWKFINDRRRD